MSKLLSRVAGRAVWVPLLALGFNYSAQSAVSCQTDFSPERVAAGEACPSQAGDFCPTTGGSAPRSCSGVSIQRISIRARDGRLSNYLVLRGSAAPESIYLALHYLNASNSTFTDVVRLQELAKVRNTLVLVPQAPSDVPNLGVNTASSGSSWPGVSSLQPLAPYVAFLDDVVADARSRFAVAALPLYVAGLSNGASMAYFYACAAASRIDAVMSVAGGMDVNTLQACTLARPIGSVIVNGTADPLVPYAGVPMLTASVAAVHTLFESRDNCLGRDRQTLMPTSGLLVPELTYSPVCSPGGRRHFLVSLRGGAHYWPGQVTDGLFASGILGPKTYVFDATLQGYDLLRKASGR